MTYLKPNNTISKFSSVRQYLNSLSNDRLLENVKYCHEQSYDNYSFEFYVNICTFSNEFFRRNNPSSYLEKNKTLPLTNQKRLNNFYKNKFDLQNLKIQPSLGIKTNKSIIVSTIKQTTNEYNHLEFISINQTFFNDELIATNFDNHLYQ